MPPESFKVNHKKSAKNVRKKISSENQGFFTDFSIETLLETVYYLFSYSLKVSHNVKFNNRVHFLPFFL